MTIMEEKIRILCVDDERNVLRALKRLFIDDDYEILDAVSGEEGLGIMRNVTPVQIVISDYRMPGMNGVDFLKEVCRHWPETVRIVLSGFSDMAAVISAINEGQIYKFVPKPWNDDELKITVSNAIDLYFLNVKNRRITSELQTVSEKLSSLKANFEKFVEERTSGLISQVNKLIFTQNILESLPVAIITIDPDGVIDTYNKKCRELFNGVDEIISGKSGKDLLPEYMDNIIHTIRDKRVFDGYISMNKNISNVHVKGIPMAYPDERNGVVLVFD